MGRFKIGGSVYITLEYFLKMNISKKSLQKFVELFLHVAQGRVADPVVLEPDPNPTVRKKDCVRINILQYDICTLLQFWSMNTERKV